MTEIEKMYENANAYKMLCNCEFKNLYDYRIEYGSDVCDYTESKIKEPCKVCEKAKQKIKYYPDFTAEKQIVILMFILNKFGDIGFQKMYSITGNNESTRKDFIKCLCDCEHETWDSRPVDFYYQKGASGDNLEESLAGLINHLWQSLTDQEKEEIRNILNA